MIELRILGPLEVKGADGDEISSLPGAPKRLGLLAYLVLAAPRGFARRDTLLALFWPDLSPRRARGSLRSMLHALRQDLGGDAIRSHGSEEVGVDPARLWCDALAFEAHLEAGRLAEALALHRGPLLPGFFVPNASPALDHWLEAARARLQRRGAEAARTLAAEAEGKDDLEAALRWTRKAASLAPYSEEILRARLRLLVQKGNPARALVVYHAFARRLADELEVDPADETRALVETIREGTTGAAAGDPGPGGVPPGAPPGAPPGTPVSPGGSALPSESAPGADGRGGDTPAPERPSPAPGAPRPTPRQQRGAVAAGLVLGTLLLAAGVSLWVGGEGRDAAPFPESPDPDRPGAGVAGSEASESSGPVGPPPAADPLDQARHAFERGETDRAEALFREVLSMDPRSLEGWWGLGEVLFHQAPFRGDPLGNARVAFEHVLAFEPGHAGARWHLARIAAAEGDAASVATLVEALLEAPAEGVPELEVEALAAFVDGREDAKRQVLERLARAPSARILAAARTVALHAGDWEGADRILARVTDPGRPAEMQAMGLVLRAHLALASGRLTAARGFLEAAEGQVPGWGLPYLALFEMAPLHAGSEGALRDLHARVQSWEVDAAAPLGQGEPFHPGDHRIEARRYLAGALALALGEPGATERDPPHDHRTWLARSLEARALHRSGAHADALALLREEEAHAAPTPFNLGAWNRYLKAELLVAAGDPEAALSWYGSFGGGRLRDLVLLAPSHLRRAELHHEAGDAARAARHYARFAALWQGADPVFQPVVERAARRAEELAGASLPQGGSAP